MSRQKWMNMCQSSNARASDWRTAFHHTPLEGRTTDPQALEWDEACEIFQGGVYCARRGDLHAGRAQIASAFLLDSRSINFCLELPAPEASDLALDAMLLYQLITSDESSFASSVLRILAARHLGFMAETDQALIAEAMTAIEQLIKALEQRPELERPAEEGGVLGGCLTRPNLYMQRSSLHMAMGNHKLAIKDLTQALKVDPNYTPARDARASLYGLLNLKDHATIHAEYKRIISEVHVDNRANEVSYAWLTITTLENPTLGTIEDAKRYYEKCQWSMARRTELYGPRPKEQEPSILEVVKQKMEMWQKNPNMQRLRRDADRAVRTGDTENFKVPDGFLKVERPGPDKRLHHVCLNCSKTAIDTGHQALMKCGRCKKVSYCSKECQTQDWKKHKAFCKQAVAEVPKFDLPPAQRTKQQDSVAKEPISEQDGQARACARMKEELQVLFAEHGQRFADWWHGKAKAHKKGLLRDVTNNTMQPTRPSKEAIQLHGSLCLCEYNLEELTGTCSCSINADGECSEHIYSDKLLHEFYIRVIRPELADFVDRDVCRRLRENGTLVDVFPTLTILVPPKEETDGPEKYDSQVMVFSEDAPASEIQKWQGRIDQGLVRDANAEFWVVRRQLFALSVLVKLFDTYQEKVRRCLARQPYERLIGCTACNQTCEGNEATKCQTCRAAWWCCQGCKMASDHGRKCPQPGPCDSKVFFR